MDISKGSPKLKIKNELLHQNLRLNWCERHLIETCFPDLFFSDESTFYLDNPVGARWVKDKENYIHAKNKGRKVGAWAAISSRGKTSLYLYEHNMNTQNYLKVLEEAIEEMKELRDISRDVLFLQIDNARYHWSIEALEFYYENNIKIIDWPPYSTDLNPIENIWAIMKRKIAGKTFTTINSLKNELYTIWRELDDEMIMKTWMSIYNRMNDWIEGKGCLTNY